MMCSEPQTNAQVSGGKAARNGAEKLITLSALVSIGLLVLGLSFLCAVANADSDTSVPAQVNCNEFPQWAAAHAGDLAIPGIPTPGNPKRVGLTGYQFKVNPVVTFETLMPSLRKKLSTVGVRERMLINMRSNALKA